MKLHTGSFSRDGVDDLAGQAPEDGIVFLAALAPAAHHVETLFDFRHEFWNFFRGILQIRVQRHHHLAFDFGKGSKNGRVLAVVAVEFHNLDARLSLGDLQQHLQRTVLAPVVGEDQLPVSFSSKILVQNFGEPLPQLRDVGFFVVDRDDDREIGAHEAILLSAP